MHSRLVLLMFDRAGWRDIRQMSKIRIYWHLIGQNSLGYLY